MRHLKIKSIILSFGLMLPSVWCNNTFASNLNEGHSPIAIKAGSAQGIPKGSAIQASISGHTLTVAFSQNIGQVAVEIATASGTVVQCLSVLTPNGMQCYIPTAGDYIVTFTLANGDEYYGEFTVTD